MIELPWGPLHFRAIGAGEPVLLVSGLNGLAAPWEAVAARLASGYRVISHDHRGLGASGAWDGGCSVDQIAGDVIGLMDALGIGRAHVVGHSLGGAVAQALAVDHPDRVGRLAIYASWAGYDPYFDRVMSARRTVLTTLGVTEFLRTGPIGIYPPRWIRDHHAELEAGLPALIAGFVGTRTMLARIDACLAHDRRASLPGIGAPTLVLGMADDGSTPPHCSEDLMAHIPGSVLRMLPYGGHNAHLVVPGEVAECLGDFLAVG